jgi:hypothetical protein
MKYFGHQCNASQDPRLKRLRKSDGSVGIDLYWRCLEIVGDKINPKNTRCRLEWTPAELATDINSKDDLVVSALETMSELGLCHIVPHGIYFPKALKYADKAMRNAFPGELLENLMISLISELEPQLCHKVPHCAPKEVKLKEVKLSLNQPIEVPQYATVETETAPSNRNGHERKPLTTAQKARRLNDNYATLDKPNLPDEVREALKAENRALEESL